MIYKLNSESKSKQSLMFISHCKLLALFSLLIYNFVSQEISSNLRKSQRDDLVIYKNSNSFQIFMTELNYFSTWRFYDWFPLSKFAINSMHTIYHFHMLFVFFLKAYIFTMTATTSWSKKFHRKNWLPRLNILPDTGITKTPGTESKFYFWSRKGF